ncbi:hypothetical protein BAC2_00405 [uncultured bacterium]|nr:hypothetical protein BAC2_00405 [uncultured bacterium]
MNVDRTVEFVRSKGNEVEQARLRYILANERPSPKIIAQLFAGQQLDGGWVPFWASDYTSLDATCYRLARLSNSVPLAQNLRSGRRFTFWLSVKRSMEVGKKMNRSLT